MSHNITQPVTVERSLSADPDSIFAALTQSQGWMKLVQADPYTILQTEGEIVAGNQWRMHVRNPEGKTDWSHGIIRDLQPSHRLAFTWIWEHDNVLGPETLVTITLVRQKQQTLIRLVHEFLPTEAKQSLFEQIWSNTLEVLEESLLLVAEGSA